MLVLLRKQDESIRIGGIKVTVLEIDRRRQTVKLGIDAPREVPVHREEIYNMLLEKMLEEGDDSN